MYTVGQQLAIVSGTPGFRRYTKATVAKVGKNHVVVEDEHGVAQKFTLRGKLWGSGEIWFADHLSDIAWEHADELKTTGEAEREAGALRHQIRNASLKHLSLGHLKRIMAIIGEGSS